MEGKKNDQGKLRYDLIPPGPLAELARVYNIGAGKYADRNWENGIEYGRIFAALQRHAWAYWNGENRDVEDGQHHLASVAWCAFALIEYERTHPELDNRPGKSNADAKFKPIINRAEYLRQVEKDTMERFLSARRDSANKEPK
jgi:hypothetical protein